MQNRHHVVGKLGNMRKEVEWTVYPYRTGEDIQIQSDNRIARVDLETGKAFLPDKGKYNPAFQTACRVVDVPATMLEAIKAITSGDDGSGTIVLKF